MSAEDRAGQVNRRTAVTLAGGLAATAAVGGVVWMGSALSQPGPADIVMMSAVDLSNAIKTKQVSCVEVMTAYLDHIGRINPKVNAIVSLQDRGGLLAQARERDEQLARGEPLGWMHGFPQAPKDLSCRAGHPHDAGFADLQGFRADDGCDRRRAREAGGRDHHRQDQHAGIRSRLAHLQQSVRNDAQRLRPDEDSGRQQRRRCGVARARACCPWRTAATTAARCAIPAPTTMCSGLRVSCGRVPAEGADAFNAALSVNGPMARTVSDLAMLLSVQAGYDPRVPLSNRAGRRAVHAAAAARFPRHARSRGWAISAAISPTSRACSICAATR